MVQKAEEPFGVHPEGDEVESCRGPVVAGLPGEERELGAALWSGDHQRPVRVLRPVLVLGDHGQAQRPLIPAGRFVAVVDEELDVVDLADGERGAWSGRGRLVTGYALCVLLSSRHAKPLERPGSLIL